MPLWLEIATGIVTIGGGIIGIGVAMGYINYFMIRSQVLEITKKLEKRLDKIEENLQATFTPFIDLLSKEPLNPLTKEENETKDHLLKEMQYRKLTIPEAKELQNVLQKELQEAQSRGDTAITIAIVSVLFLLAFILSKE